MSVWGVFVSWAGRSSSSQVKVTAPPVAGRYNLTLQVRWWRGMDDPSWHPTAEAPVGASGYLAPTTQTRFLGGCRVHRGSCEGGVPGQVIECVRGEVGEVGEEGEVGEAIHGRGGGGAGRPGNNGPIWLHKQRVCLPSELAIVSSEAEATCAAATAHGPRHRCFSPARSDSIMTSASSWPTSVPASSWARRSS